VNNIPDGEVYTAPVRDSVEGTIQFNTPSLEEGTTFERVRLTFKAGRVVASDANEPAKLLGMLDTDEGSRYLGEFALGLNPMIKKAMKDTLFDEKIRGSLHLALGRAYDDADNGNRASVHWDLVLLQESEWGGGEVYFDDVLVRKDGPLRLAGTGWPEPPRICFRRRPCAIRAGNRSAGPGRSAARAAASRHKGSRLPIAPSPAPPSTRRRRMRRR